MGVVHTLRYTGAHIEYFASQNVSKYAPALRVSALNRKIHVYENCHWPQSI